MRELTRQPGWSVQAHGGYLALWRGGIPIADYGPTFVFGSESSGGMLSIAMRLPGRFCPAREHPKLLEDALTLHDALNRAKSNGGAAPIIPAIGGTPRTQQGDRLAGSAIGALIGLLCGIIIAAAGLFAWTSSDAAKRLGGVSSIVTGVIFFGGILLGTATGAVLGAVLSATLPLRRKRNP